MSAPQEILSDQLAKQIGDRTVTTAVFTTFNFDPGFFELHILPLLFPTLNFSEADKVRLAQVEDAIGSLSGLAVYYDANALAIDGESPRLGYDRIAVHRTTGCFHLKLVLLLITDQDESEHESLIVCCQSANITRAGWWENIECAHIEEVKHRRVADYPCTFRRDLRAILDRVKSNSSDWEEHSALDKIRDFIDTQTVSPYSGSATSLRSRGTRLFGGATQVNFYDWLISEGSIPKHWNLEVISPYFDKSNANAVDKLVKATEPSQTRVFLPKSEDGTALISQAVLEQVRAIPTVDWGTLPSEMRSRKGGASSDALASRFVHAKIYRFWKREHDDQIIVGSVNCTRPAHGSAYQGNLEAAFLIDTTEQRIHRRWWMDKLNDESVECTLDIPQEDDDADAAQCRVDVRYDWQLQNASVRVDSQPGSQISVCDLTENTLFEVDPTMSKDWKDLGSETAARVEEAISKSSFLIVTCSGVSWRILVRETGNSHRPSLVADLTSNEIMQYWSLLSPTQRVEALERKENEKGDANGSPRGKIVDSAESVFHKFSGIFHAFGHLRRHLYTSIENDRLSQAEYRLLGKKYDSLPNLLCKMLEDEEADAVFIYITFLTAKQLRLEIESKFPEFLRDREHLVEDLDDLISKGMTIRKELGLGSLSQSERFLEWYEYTFLNLGKTKE